MSSFKEISVVVPSDEEALDFLKTLAFTATAEEMKNGEKSTQSCNPFFDKYRDQYDYRGISKRSYARLCQEEEMPYVLKITRYWENSPERNLDIECIPIFAENGKKKKVICLLQVYAKFDEYVGYYINIRHPSGEKIWSNYSRVIFNEIEKHNYQHRHKIFEDIVDDDE